MPSPKKNDKTRDLKEKLFRKPIPAWDKLSKQEKKQAFTFAREYRDFLNHCRTERAAVKYFVEQASKTGFSEIDSRKQRGPKLFRAMRGKALVIAIIGKRSIKDGVRLIASHIDCPRLDLKPNPLYEDMGLALLKTQYYGGIKKYQWVSEFGALRRDSSC